MKNIIVLMLLFILSNSVYAEQNDTIGVLTKSIELCKVEKCSNERLSELYRYRALVYKDEVHDRDKAFADYVQAVKYNPNDAIALTNVSIYKSLFGDNEGALEDAKKVLLLKPDNAVCHSWKATLHSQLNQYDLAIKEYTEAIKLRPKNPTAFYGRGICEISLGKKDKGLQDLGYAKQQYYEAGDIENYKLMVKIINMQKSRDAENKYKSETDSTTKELQKINRTLNDMRIDNLISR